jgi:hypothetical protein
MQLVWEMEEKSLLLISLFNYNPISINFVFSHKMENFMINQLLKCMIVQKPLKKELEKKIGHLQLEVLQKHSKFIMLNIED